MLGTEARKTLQNSIEALPAEAYGNVLVDLTTCRVPPSNSDLDRDPPMCPFISSQIPLIPDAMGETSFA